MTVTVSSVRCSCFERTFATVIQGERDMETVEAGEGLKVDIVEGGEKDLLTGFPI